MDLAPTTFDEHVSITPVLISRGYPYGMLAGWFLPPARLPRISIAIPTMIAGNPNMPPAGPNSAVLVNADRRAQLDHYLRVSGYYPHGDSKKRGQTQFFHLVLQRLHRHGDGRFKVFTNQKGLAA
jgi:hypothetical protein